MHDCSISSANALEILQSCTKPVIYDLEENFVQIHLPDWQFYLPRPSGSGICCVLMVQVVEILPVGDRELIILHCKYLCLGIINNNGEDSLWPGDAI